MSKKDEQIGELYDNVSTLHAKVRALKLLLLQVANIVNKDVKPLGPLNDARFYMLRNAAAMGDWDDVDMLIQADRSIVAATNSLEETALHFLVVEDRLDAVKGLAELGCDVNGNSTSILPMEEAALLSHYEMVDLLVQLGARINVSELLRQAEERNGKKGRKQVKSILTSHKIKTK